MDDNSSKNVSYTAGFFIVIAFALAGLLVAGAAMIPIWKSMTGESFQNMEKGMSNPANSNAVKLMQVITEIFVFFIPALIAAAILNRKPFKLLGFSIKINFRQIGLAISIVLVALFVSAALSYFNERIPLLPSLKEAFDKAELDYNKQIEAIIGLNSVGEYIVALFVMAFIPALCEETLFRGGLQNFMTRSTKKPWLSIVVVSILFSVAHLSFYGFLSRFFLGMILGFLYHYSGKLWITIIAHFLNNALALTVIYVYKTQGQSISKAMNETDSGWQGILGLPILILLMYAFYKMHISRDKQDHSAMTQFENEKPSHGI